MTHTKLRETRVRKGAPERRSPIKLEHLHYSRIKIQGLHRRMSLSHRLKDDGSEKKGLPPLFSARTRQMNSSTELYDYRRIECCNHVLHGIFDFLQIKRAQILWRGGLGNWLTELWAVTVQDIVQKLHSFMRVQSVTMFYLMRQKTTVISVVME